MFAEIIIPLALPKNYTWSVPAELEQQVLPGCRVEVVLGKNKKYAGVVKRLHHESPSFEVKDMLNVLDAEPIVFAEQLALWACDVDGNDAAGAVGGFGEPADTGVVCQIADVLRDAAPSDGAHCSGSRRIFQPGTGRHIFRRVRRR